MKNNFLTTQLALFPILLALLVAQFNFGRLNVWASVAAVLALMAVTVVYSVFNKPPTERSGLIFYALLLGYVFPAALIFLNSTNLNFTSLVLIFLSSFPATVSIFDVLLSKRIIMHNSPANAKEVESLRRDLIIFSTSYVLTFFAIAAAILFAFLPWTAFLLFAALVPVFNNVVKFVTRPFILANANLAMRNYWMMTIALLLGLLFGIAIR